MKSYTNLKQSKNLSNILPLTSADMHYERAYFEGKQSDWFIALGKPIKSDDIIPCWSLAALLSVINKTYYVTLLHDGVMWNILVIHHDIDKCNHTIHADSPIDACVEMILKLYELKKL